MHPSELFAFLATITGGTVGAGGIAKFLWGWWQGRVQEEKAKNQQLLKQEADLKADLLCARDRAEKRAGELEEELADAESWARKLDEAYTDHRLWCMMEHHVRLSDLPPYPKRNETP